MMQKFRFRLIMFVGVLLLGLFVMQSNHISQAQIIGGGGAVPCTAGVAGTFPCRNIDLEAVLPTHLLFTTETVPGSGSDIWGWTDDLDTPEDKSDDREIIIASNSTQTSFVDVTDPLLSYVIGVLPTPGSLNALWRDPKTVGHHVLVVGDMSPLVQQGVQIFDLHKLRAHYDTLAFHMFSISDAIVYSGTTEHPIDDAHNIVTNEDTMMAYAVGAGSCAGGLHAIDMSVPDSPTFAGCFDEDGYTHDAQCVLYHGPDTEHVGKEICVGSNEDTNTVVDMTDPANPVMLSKEGYPGHGYVHQGWFTEDQAYFISNDETDEILVGGNTRTYIFDAHDLDNLTFMGIYSHSTQSTDHNLYVKDGLVYMANYTAGLRIAEISNLHNAADPAANGGMKEVAFFDASPDQDTPATSGGSWSVYPYFESGTVVINELEQGLVVLRPNVPNFKLDHDVTTTTRAVPQPGDMVDYTSTLTNTGTVDATGIVMVMEVNGIDYTMSGATELAVGASADYTYTYTVLEADCSVADPDDVDGFGGVLLAHARSMTTEEVGRRVDLPLNTDVCDSVPLAVGLSSTTAEMASPATLFVLVLAGLTAVTLFHKRRA